VKALTSLLVAAAVMLSGVVIEAGSITTARDPLRGRSAVLMSTPISIGGFVQRATANSVAHESAVTHESMEMMEIDKANVIDDATIYRL